MSRKTITYTVEAEGRDQGKQFLMTEMSALHGQRWAIHMLFAIAAGGVNLPSGYEALGFAGLSKIALPMLLQAPLHMVEPLLKEMMDCVEIIPDPQSKPHVKRKLQDSDIDEILTYFALRKQVWDLHTGFFQNGAPSTTA